MSLFSKFLGGNKSGGSGADKASAFIQALKNDLGLDSQQQAGVEAAMRSFFADRKAAKQAGDKAKVQAEKREFKDEIMSILNSEQQQKFRGKFQVYRELLKG